MSVSLLSFEQTLRRRNELNSAHFKQSKLLHALPGRPLLDKKQTRLPKKRFPSQKSPSRLRQNQDSAQTRS